MRRLVNACWVKKILADARKPVKRKYKIPGLLSGNPKMVVGQVKAAADRKSPLILIYNQGVTPEIPLELGMPLFIDKVGGDTSARL